MSKEFKLFMRKLILCLLITEILKGNLTVEEAHTLIDASSEAQRIDYEKKKRAREIREMNKRFLSIGNRNNNIFERFRQGSYRSYFSNNCCAEVD